MTSSTVSVQWGPVECVHQNGDITGYSLQYGETNGIKNDTFVSGEDVTETIISGLKSDTSYEIVVAAVNSKGIGKYSSKIIAKTTLVEGKM